MSPRSFLKRSRTVHAGYKLVRLLPEASVRSWLHLRRTLLIGRVLPNTMVSARGLMQAYDCVAAIEHEGIPGDIAECGVWAGGTAGLMAAASVRLGSPGARRFHLFDSFEGLPQPSEHDVDVLDEFRRQFPDLPLDAGSDTGSLTAIGACAAPLEAVHELFDEVLKIDPADVVIHRGWFQETIPAAEPSIGQLSILRIDGDWYESTKVCLEGLFDKVADGGFVLIDDYNEFSGCRQALDEFLADRGVEAVLEPVEGAGVYFRKQAAVGVPQRSTAIAAPQPV